MKIVNALYKFSDSFPRDTFRYWFTHVLYNLAKDVVNICEIRRY